MTIGSVEDADVTWFPVPFRKHFSPPCMVAKRLNEAGAISTPRPSWRFGGSKGASSRNEQTAGALTTG